MEDGGGVVDLESIPSARVGLGVGLDTAAAACDASFIML